MERRMTSYKELELQVIRWAEHRHIIPNSTPLAQAIKTTEEVAELLKALSRGDMDEAKDAYGDILVTLIIGAALADVDLTHCLGLAFDQIKDRRGHLSKDGIFVKDAQ
jgi:NTP pyrophosphatase (non-canonical NTP hydrolase)